MGHPGEGQASMSKQFQVVLEAALKLPEADSLLLVERLLETLPVEQGEGTEEEFVAELRRRSADFDRGAAEAISWAELKKSL